MAAEGGGEKGGAITIVTNVALTAAGGFAGIMLIDGKPLAGIACFGYCLRGVLGLTSMVTSNEHVKKAKDIVDDVCYYFGVPLIAADATRGSCVAIFPTVVEYFIFPAGHFTAKMLDKGEMAAGLAELALGFTLGATASCIAHQSNDVARLLFVYLFGTAIFFQPKLERDWLNLILAVAVFLTWATLKNQMPFSLVI